MKNVVVFFGGKSVEHDISIITGTLILNTLSSEFCIIPIYIHTDGNFYTGESLFDIDNYKDLDIKTLKRVTFVAPHNTLYKLKFNHLKKFADVWCAINCLHGKFGEDASIVSLMKLCNIPILSSNAFQMELAMDKEMTKIFLKGLNIKTLQAKVVYDIEQVTKIKDKLTYPVIVKPATLGSSIGIEKVENKNMLESSVRNALKFDNKVIIEKCLENYTEINCAVYRGLDDKIYVSECDEPISKNDILTFDDKYLGGNHIFPAEIPKALSTKIKNIAKKIYEKGEFSGIIRIDFLISKEEIFVNEINAIPGSLAYYLFTPTLEEFSLILTDLIKKTVKDFNTNSTLCSVKETGILKDIVGKGAKRL